MIPISDVYRIRRRLPVVNLTLIVLNAFVFVYVLSLPTMDRLVFFYRWGLLPVELITGREQTHLLTTSGLLNIASPVPAWATVFMAMFIHSGWLHFLGNMVYLWVFGDSLELRLGSVRYLLLYLAWGIAAAGVQVALFPRSEVPVVGASGAIAGVLGAYLVAFPRNRIRTVVLAWFITVIDMPAVVLLLIWFVIQLLGGLNSIGGVQAGVAYGAHIGGFVAGMAYMWAHRRLTNNFSLHRRPR